MPRATAVYYPPLRRGLDGLLSRSLGWFLLFLLVLGAVAAIVLRYLGPTMIGLAFDDDQRDAPYYLVSLVKRDEAASGTQGFAAQLAQLVAAEEGHLLWRGVTLQVAEGRMRDEWQGMWLFEFARGGGVVEMLTGSGYRTVADSYAGSKRLILGTRTAPDGLAGTGAAVMSLFEVKQQHEFAGEVRALAANLVSFQGSLIWDAPVADLEGNAPFNRLLVFEFVSRASAEAWLRDPQTVTQRALIRRVASSAVTLVLQPS
tara:strand:- start:29739 stop:30515 length:777 start_codon:yes stop_codon:yes gene_type:complete